METAELSLQIEGMTCGGCVSHVDKALRSVPGVESAAVNLTTGTARVKVDKGAADGAALVKAVEGAGYGARVLADMSAKTLREIGARGEAEEKGVYDRLIMGLLFGVPAVAVEMMLHHQLFVAMHLGGALHSGYNILAASLATLVMVTTGWPFFVRAFRSALRMHASMDALVALGAGTAYVASLVSLIFWLVRPAVGIEGETQPAISEFHAAVAIVVLVTLGKYLEARAKKRASSAVAGLGAQAAATATRILADGKSETVPAEAIAIGDRVQVLAHQQLPVDGELVEGNGSLDMSVVTGESVPVELQWPVASGQWSEGREKREAAPPRKSLMSLKVMGSAPSPVAKGPVLPGGATLADGRIVIRATSTAATSTVARILELVNTAQASKTQIQALADRVAGIFVPIVLVLALGNFAVWMMLGGGWEQAMLTTIATIIIACPCAMGLATPTAITVAMGRSAKLGILFTQAAALESGRTIGTVVFDKTGTLTTGKLHLSDTLGVAYEDTPAVQTRPELTPAGQHALEVAAALEQYSEHPVAKAMVEAGRRFNLPLAAPERFSSSAGGGLTGRIGGRDYAIGSLAFLRVMNTPVDAVAADIERLTNDGKTLVGLAEKSSPAPRLLGLFAFQDTLRPEARETVARLRERGFKVGVLSGDTELAVRGAVQNMAVDFVKSGIKPEQKAASVEGLKRVPGASGKKRQRAGVAFVGDGINDGPALAAADLGIAMASGANIAKAAGDVLLMNNHLRSIPAVFELSRQTLRVIKQNLFWAFAYNVAAIPLAMAGVLPPAFAAGAMMFSSLSVVVNALRLYRVKVE